MLSRRVHEPIAEELAPSSMVARAVITRDELVSALELVHDCCVRRGQMHSHPSGIRILPHFALPGTRTWVLQVEDVPVSTVSMFPDTPLGLPGDAPFGKALEKLRSQGRRIAEAGMLADRRTSHMRTMPAVLRIMPLVYEEARTGEVDALIITCPQQHEAFYRKLVGFERVGSPRPYPSVLDSPSVLLKLDLTAPTPSRARNRKLMQILRDPVPTAGRGRTPYEMNSEDVAYFLIHRTDLFHHLPSAWRRLICRCHPKLDPAAERRKAKANRLSK
ncbi:MAG: N-acyl amino acid synthase FeeM domain-containing protein [Phycisphaerae bacterium]